MGARIKLLPANNVVANGVATIDLSNLIGFTIERIMLQIGGTTSKAVISTIQLKANGKIIWDTTGPRRDAAMQYRSITPSFSFLTLDFSEIRSKTELGQNIGAIDTTLGISNLKLEITLSGGGAGPTINGFAETNRPQIDAAQQNTRALISKIHSSTITIGAAGTFSLPVPHLSPQDGGSLFKRICFFSANMTALVIKKNGIVIEDSTKAMNDFNQAEYRKTPQTALYVFDPIVDDNQSQILNTRDAQTMEVLGTFSAGETITIESELLEPLAAF